MASSSGDEPSAESDNMAPGNGDELSTYGDASSGEIEELSGDGAELSIESDESEASVADEGLSSEHESSDWAPLEEPK
jgi:hypothetical protein